MSVLGAEVTKPLGPGDGSPSDEEEDDLLEAMIKDSQ
jgi:hypothetical protein